MLQVSLLQSWASPLTGTLGGLLALVLQQAQQRFATIGEVPGWDAALHLAQPVGSSKPSARGSLRPWHTSGVLYPVTADLRRAFR
jgi:hypothetical protein